MSDIEFKESDSDVTTSSSDSEIETNKISDDEREDDIKFDFPELEKEFGEIVLTINHVEKGIKIYIISKL